YLPAFYPPPSYISQPANRGGRQEGLRRKELAGRLHQGDFQSSTGLEAQLCPGFPHPDLPCVLLSTP
ncbi:hypothetical protein B0H11DRAFT_2201405, partial [Mycena galericulata]